MNKLGILLQIPAETADGGQGMITQIMMFGAIFLVFYFFMIRPQMKKTKEAKQFKESLVNGTKVVTIGGVHGKIMEVKDETVIIEVEGGHRLKLDKAAIAKEFAVEEIAKK
jgi:preprotein translocase subunit YajC